MKPKKYQAPEVVLLGQAVRLTEGRNKYVADVAGSGLYYDAKGTGKIGARNKKGAAKKKRAKKAGRKKTARKATSRKTR